jgi:biopolymer transport protein ExbD
MPKVHPAADTGPGRLARGRRVSTSLSEMNVVPLVDVMLVLLIIFMVASPMIQRGIDVRLPVSTRASTITGERIYVTLKRDFPQKQTVWLGTEEIRLSALAERIRQLMEASAEKKIYLQGERGIVYDDVVRIIDVMKAAGVADVGLVTDIPAERRP